MCRIQSEYLVKHVHAKRFKQAWPMLKDYDALEGGELGNLKIYF
jgi:hypothetical protein